MTVSVQKIEDIGSAELNEKPKAKNVLQPAEMIINTTALTNVKILEEENTNKEQFLVKKMAAQKPQHDR